MTRPRLVQSLTPMEALVVLLVLGAITYAAISIATRPPGNRLDDPLIAGTAYWPVWLWCLGSPVVLEAQRPPWFRVVRLVDTTGFLTLMLHLAAAFHLGHGWSHSRAYQHVEEISGFGPGLYVNYAFAGIWLADVAWMWIDSRGYRERSRRLSWGILLFMAFIVFNAAIVFGHGANRIISAGFFLIPLTVIAITRPWAASGRAQKTGTRPEAGFAPEPSITDDHSPT